MERCIVLDRKLREILAIAADKSLSAGPVETQVAEKAADQETAAGRWSAAGAFEFVSRRWMRRRLSVPVAVFRRERRDRRVVERSRSGVRAAGRLVAVIWLVGLFVLARAGSPGIEPG